MSRVQPLFTEDHLQPPEITDKIDLSLAVWWIEGTHAPLEVITMVNLWFHDLPECMTSQTRFRDTTVSSLVMRVGMPLSLQLVEGVDKRSPSRWRNAD